MQYSTNIVNNNNKKIKEKYNFKFLSSNNFSMPKKKDKIKNITYDSFYNNNNTSFNKDQKNRIFSDRVYSRSYKTILNNYNNENKYENNKEILDQQILDYLNKNNEEKKNLIKKMKNQKIFYNKTMAEKNMLNLKEISNNKENKNKKNKIMHLNNLNSYSYINNNYNHYCSSNNNNSTYNNLNNTNNDNSHLYNNYTYNNYELLISKHYNSSKQRDTNIDNSNIKAIYPNYIKSKPKKPMNKKHPLRINNFKNENIDINNVIRNDSLLYQSHCNNNIRNYPYNKTFKDLAKTQFIKPINYGNNFYDVINYKIPLSDPRVVFSSQNIFKEVQNFTENNESEKNLDTNYIKNGINNKIFIGKQYKDKIIMNKSMMKKNLRKNINKNVIQKSYNLFFRNSNTTKNKNERNNIPINKKMNLTTRPEKPEKVNLKKKIPYNYNHKKSNSINSINNKKINKNNLKISYNVNTDQSIKSKDSDKCEKKEMIINEKGIESMRMSVQSINDSKLMEMVDKFIVEEENLDKNEIAEILNIKKREF